MQPILASRWNFLFLGPTIRDVVLEYIFGSAFLLIFSPLGFFSPPVPSLEYVCVEVREEGVSLRMVVKINESDL